MGSRINGEKDDAIRGHNPLCEHTNMPLFLPLSKAIYSPHLQSLQNMNCRKTDLNFASFISDYNPIVTIQAVMHEITADPAVFSNYTLH